MEIWQWINLRSDVAVQVWMIHLWIRTEPDLLCGPILHAHNAGNHEGFGRCVTTVTFEAACLDAAKN